jgi:O-antigen/teichoic acid export membrane protein
MLFAISFFLNVAANFALNLSLSAILGPAEFGRYSTVQLGAIALSTGLLDWLRHATLRYSGDDDARVAVASSLEAGYFILTLAAYVLVGGLALFGATFGLGAVLLLLTPLLGVATHRVDFTAARFRARDEARAFAGIYALRQMLSFTAVVAVALYTRAAAPTVAAFAAANLIAAIAFAARARVVGTALRNASLERLKTFFVYAKPIAFSMVVYSFIGLVNRHVALTHLGPEATGRFSLATDLGLRLFGAATTVPEIVLFQMVLRLDRAEGRQAAEAQLGRNIALALAYLTPLAAAYAVMAPTLEALLAPAAYRGPLAALGVILTPGYFSLFALIAAVSPIFQLRGLTGPLSLASLLALAVDCALLYLTSLSDSLEGIAIAYSAGLVSALLATSLLALRVSKVRPRARDLLVIAAATALMAALARPLNSLSSPLAAAALAGLVGAAVMGGAYYAFDIGGLRTLLREAAGAWTSRRRKGAAVGIASGG